MLNGENDDFLVRLIDCVVDGASSIEAAERSFDVIIRCELAVFRLSKSFQDGRQVRGINRLRHSLVTRQGEHRTRDFVLAARWQPADCFECCFQELCHGFIICGLLAEMEEASNRRVYPKRHSKIPSSAVLMSPNDPTGVRSMLVRCASVAPSRAATRASVRALAVVRRMTTPCSASPPRP
jgi:hypothetical protein